MLELLRIYRNKDKKIEREREKDRQADRHRYK